MFTKNFLTFVCTSRVCCGLRQVARKAELEGEYRYLHSRLIANAEEVAFYKGHDIEKDYIQDAYTDLEEHMKVAQPIPPYYYTYYYKNA